MSRRISLEISWKGRGRQTRFFNVTSPISSPRSMAESMIMPVPRQPCFLPSSISKRESSIQKMPFSPR